MKNKIIDILTSFELPKKLCAMGNEAAARGALEAGVEGVFAYPGTPSTEISEIFSQVSTFQHDPENKEEFPKLTDSPVYFEFSINEKIALEKAIAFSIGNKPALSIMKNVGMNVASDALMSITYQSIIAPLVIILCDDPGCHSSSNEQDSRHWGQMANVPVFNPADPADTIRMAKDAFLLSAKLRLPVILRMTTRVCHSRGMLHYGSMDRSQNQARFDRIPEFINIPARTAAAHVGLLNKLNSSGILPFFNRNHNLSQSKGGEFGIISSGVSTAYLREALNVSGLEKEVSVLDLGLIHPFPQNEVIAFLESGLKNILVLEELDPIIENAIRLLAQKQNIDCRIEGKGFKSLSSTGEYNLEIVREAIHAFLGSKANGLIKTNLPGFEEWIRDLPPRPPALCSGCPHRATFYALKLAIPRETSEFILCGDIGCFGLGALAPLKMIDTINHMGMSISMAQGLAEGFRNSKSQDQKVVAMVGDGTFFHSGIASLLNAVYTRANILLIIFDNRTIGMTGRQDHPGASQANKYREIEIEPLVRGMGVQFLETIDPFNLKDSFEKINAAAETEGVAVIISRAPCIFLPDYVKSGNGSIQLWVDPTLCNSCHNQEDENIACSRCPSSKSNLVRARAKLLAKVHIPAKQQQCPANICNHGFFNSILEKDYGSAVSMVRDKILFSRTCGSVCHRPCENADGHESPGRVPIRQLKKYVSSFDDHFLDFSIPLDTVKNAEIKDMSVAVVGSGPAGLSAAYDLVRNGYKVSIFEKQASAGGLVSYGIPGFRMDKVGFDREIGLLQEMGVTFHFNQALGTDYELPELEEEYNAVVLAIGMGKPNSLDLIESSIPQDKRSDAISFLKSYNFKSIEMLPGSRILVIGAGNSAIDAARAATRIENVVEVSLSCVESWENMPAFAEETAHALSEGVRFLNQSSVQSCKINHNGKIDLGFCSSVTGEKLPNHEIDLIITAIGQTGESEVMQSLGADDLEKNGRVKASRENGRVGERKLFVAGDLCSGNHMSVIGAIGSGKRAANGVRQLLEGYAYPYEGQEALEQLNSETGKSWFSPDIGSDEQLIKEMDQFDLFQACQKCNHCIDNFGCPAMVRANGKVTIDLAKCAFCGLCVDVCPNNAIQWINKKELTPE